MSNGKDPAALFYIDKWLVATAEMDADLRGWYLNLILHQYDKKSLPNDVEALAVLANVKFSEFERFKQMFEQVLKHKFKQDDEGRLKQHFAAEVIQAREKFTEKRGLAGKIGYFIKFVKRVHGDDYKFIEYLKNEIDFEKLDYYLRNNELIGSLFLFLLSMCVAVVHSATAWAYVSLGARPLLDLLRSRGILI